MIELNTQTSKQANGVGFSFFCNKHSFQLNQWNKIPNDRKRERDEEKIIFRKPVKRMRVFSAEKRAIAINK